MLSRTRALAAALLLCSIPGSALAQEVAEGIYLGGTFNTSFENFSNTGFLDFDEAFGAGVRLGSRIHPLIAVEAQYEWTGVFESDTGGAEVELEQHVVTANGKLFLLPGPVEPFLHLLGYFLRSGPCLSGQFFYFVGHHGKAFACLTG